MAQARDRPAHRCAAARSHSPERVASIHQPDKSACCHGGPLPRPSPKSQELLATLTSACEFEPPPSRCSSIPRAAATARWHARRRTPAVRVALRRVPRAIISHSEPSMDGVSAPRPAAAWSENVTGYDLPNCSRVLGHACRADQVTVGCIPRPSASRPWVMARARCRAGGTDLRAPLALPCRYPAPRSCPAWVCASRLEGGSGLRYRAHAPTDRGAARDVHAPLGAERERCAVGDESGVTVF